MAESPTPAPTTEPPTHSPELPALALLGACGCGSGCGCGCQSGSPCQCGGCSG
ncbi:hypothetical protein AB0J21_03910 [Streptomyces sp. NPDC049954]|uniref:hypothetical protein n=1 Tax=Streptomyces sp. NPDC049954 TaxID=3155779 RepID=UPI00342B7D7A